MARIALGLGLGLGLLGAVGPFTSDTCLPALPGAAADPDASAQAAQGTPSAFFLGNAFLGVVVPAASVLARDPHPGMAGLASALGGMLQAGEPLPVVAAIGVCGALAFRSALVLPPRRAPRRAVA